MPNSILVIGSVLLDIVGTYNNTEKDFTNKTGKLNFTIGGVAFNIASNLSSKNKPTAILTCLKSNSISSKAIKDTLENSNIKQHIYSTDQIEETGYVAHFCDKKLKTGITSSEIEGIDIMQIKGLSKIINSSSFVVIDTNLSETQISVISTICKRHNKKIFVNVVSDAKFERIYKKEFQCKFECTCIRKDELESQKIIIEDIVKSQQNIKDFCKDLNSHVIYVNNELEGYFILLESGEHEYRAVNYSKIDIKNTLGANDALFSAVCATEFDKKSIKGGDEVKLTIKAWVIEVLKVGGSNFANFERKPKDRKQETYKTLATIIFLLLAVTSTVIGSFIPNLDLLYFGILIFSIALFGGSSGALSRDMVARLTSQKRNSLKILPLIALGMIAGTLSSLIGILPGIATGGGISQLSNQDLLPLMIFIVSISTGIALDLFFEKLSKNNPDEILEIY